MNNKNQVFGSIILAAGKGRRMQSETFNKVSLHLANKPMILHIIHFMQKLPIQSIVVVVGYAKESVMNALKNENVLFAEQEEQLGTSHAVRVGLGKLPKTITDVLIVYGDDAVLYIEKQLHLIQKLFSTHQESDAVVTFLTIDQENPFGLGRIIRNNEGEAVAIIEEKDATEEQKKIKEINPGCYLFQVDFLNEYLPIVKKSPVTGEYYLTDLVDIAIENNKIVKTVQGGMVLWRGVNTPEELEEAHKLMELQ